MEMRDILKVTSVGVVPASLGFRSKQSNDMRVSNRPFGEHLYKAKMGSADWSANLEGATLGYTRSAQAYFSPEMQREYTF